ncbi:hypothetical protein [Protofrankia symbiont of Coriaria ruscifolia]|nr:hypothetical protein [Protofrankia symbiont of Coriaria ruscifolia]
MDALLRLAALIDQLLSAADEAGDGGVCPMSAVSPTRLRLNGEEPS